MPEASGPMNAFGVAGPAAAEGRVGTLAGLPVYLDSNLPTTVSTNQDIVIVANSNETLLYESSVRVRVLPEVLSGTLTVRIQLWGYVAQLTRQAKSIAIISGTGAAPPVFT